MGEEITTIELLSRVIQEGQMCEKACWVVTNSRRHRGEVGKEWSLT